MCDELKINELVNMMDSLMSKGGGHVEIKVEDDNIEAITTTTYKSNDCGCGNKACQVPTLHKGIDD